MSKHLIKIESTPHGVLGVRHTGLDQQYCEAGELVILEWQPDAKWGLQEAHYTDGGGNVTTIDLTRVKVDGVDVVAFIMPNAEITVGGTFKRFVAQDWTQGTNPSLGEVLMVGENGEPTPIPVDELANQITEGDNDLVDSISQLEAVETDIAVGRASINLFNKEELVTGKIISLSAGTLSNRTDGACSAKIPVIGGHYYLLSGRVHQSNSGIRCFDSSNVTMKVRVASTGEEFSTWNLPNEAGTDIADNGQFLVPSNAETVQFGVRYNTTDVIDDIMLVDLGETYVVNPETPEFEPYGGLIYSVKKSALPAEILNFNPLYGKKVCYDGDSIARGGESSSEYGWSPIIAEKNDGTFVSRAVGGGTITNGTYNSGGSARHWICNGIETIYNNGENPDYIIFEGGTNDADVIGSILDQDNLPALFGSWTETDFVGPFDKDTFCGAVEYMFQKALSLFPHTKFGFIIAQKMGENQANSMVRNRKAYFDVIMKICRKWGVPYIDLWDEGFLNPTITSHYNPSLDADENIEAHSLYRDGQHLTLYGYQVITEKINAWMKTL